MHPGVVDLRTAKKSSLHCQGSSGDEVSEYCEVPYGRFLSERLTSQYHL